MRSRLDTVRLFLSVVYGQRNLVRSALLKDVRNVLSFRSRTVSEIPGILKIGLVCIGCLPGGKILFGGIGMVER